MEARIARLESDVAHLRSDMAEVKADVRALRDKTDALAIGTQQGFAGLNSSIASAKVWALLLYIALAAALFGTMARGFGWL